MEVHLERDAEEGEEGEEPTPIITVEQEEEVVLFWSEGAERKYKSILELAESAKYNEDDNHILQYYRCCSSSISYRSIPLVTRYCNTTGATRRIFCLFYYLSLLLGLFPSSGVDGMVGISFFHFVLSSTSSSFNPTLSISPLHKSFHLVFCLPLCLFPSTGASNILLSTCYSSLLLTHPYHFSLFTVIYFATDATFTAHFTCSFLILSFFVTPPIHRSILISFTCSLFSWLFVVSHVSAPIQQFN